MPKTLAVKLTPQGQRHLRAKHPWIYSDSIERLKGDGQAGDLCIIFERKKDRVIGIGLYDPNSPIRIKLIHHGGKANINEAFFQQGIATAYQRRSPLLQTDTNAFRLLNGENDGFPSLIVDVYAGVAVVKVYSLIWVHWLGPITDYLESLLNTQAIVLRLSRNVQRDSNTPASWQDGNLLRGELPNPELVFREHGVLLGANVIAGHKTGFFLDHRHNRQRVGALAQNKRVLDVFSYAGGFSVHALAGGASEVTSVDISKQALQLAQENAALNGFTDQLKLLPGDAFELLAQLQRENKTFDLIVVDPPSFAKAAKEIPGALQAYRKLTRLAIPLVAKGGILLLASCSARVDAETFFNLQLEELHAARRKFNELERTAHDIDHPIGFAEGAYLKSIYVRLE